MHPDSQNDEAFNGRDRSPQNREDVFSKLVCLFVCLFVCIDFVFCCFVVVVMWFCFVFVFVLLVVCFCFPFCLVLLWFGSVGFGLVCSGLLLF